MVPTLLQGRDAATRHIPTWDILYHPSTMGLPHLLLQQDGSWAPEGIFALDPKAKDAATKQGQDQGTHQLQPLSPASVKVAPLNAITEHNQQKLY